MGGRDRCRGSSFSSTEIETGGREPWPIALGTGWAAHRSVHSCSPPPASAHSVHCILCSALSYCICSATTTATSTTASAQEALGRWSATGAFGAGSWSPKPAPLLGGCASNWSTFELGQQITLWQQLDASRDLTFRSTRLENFKTMI